MNEDSSVVEAIMDTGYNHESCICPCTKTANSEDTCFDKCFKDKGFYLK